MELLGHNLWSSPWLVTGPYVIHGLFYFNSHKMILSGKYYFSRPVFNIAVDRIA